MLHDPNELVAMVGMPADLLNGATRITGWSRLAPSLGDSSGNTFNRRLVYLLAALGVLIPIGVFVAASTRIGATTRERRFAAMRLVGATPQQVALAAALEAAAAGLIGGLVGLSLALVLRTRAEHIGIAGYAAFPSDLAPPLWQVAAILIAAPLLAAVTSLGSMRRVAVTPLGVRRRQVPGRPSARRLVPLALSWAELAWAVHAGDALTEDGKLVALGIGFTGVVLGIVVAGPWLVGALASVVASSARGPGALIAGRRLQAHHRPPPSGRSAEPSSACSRRRPCSSSSHPRSAGRTPRTASTRTSRRGRSTPASRCIRNGAPWTRVDALARAARCDPRSAGAVPAADTSAAASSSRPAPRRAVCSTTG